MRWVSLAKRGGKHRPCDDCADFLGDWTMQTRSPSSTSPHYHRQIITPIFPLLEIISKYGWWEQGPKWNPTTVNSRARSSTNRECCPKCKVG
ncbi:unnamed protein product [Lactuca saligna]|uniref:Uncharacterized protein n=1 Tax=Lactuca saligna TaxID=75948 RepID=A0AA36DV87_LACSI|nr:unnamed protein product [Lactuca saligna]